MRIWLLRRGVTNGYNDMDVALYLRHRSLGRGPKPLCANGSSRRSSAAASGGPSSATSRRQNLEIALLRSVFQRLPLLQQHHAVQCQVERSIAVMRYQRQVLQLLVTHRFCVSDVAHINEIGL